MAAENLLAKKCVPCEGGTPHMSREAAGKYLEQVPGWILQPGDLEPAGKIEREFPFKSFKAAMRFVNSVADIAEGEGHHPNIYLFDYRKVRLTLTTHAIGGLSENDFILAAKINKLDSIS